eukprot:933159-Pelagomonas_calceolata.AAC.6
MKKTGLHSCTVDASHFAEVGATVMRLWLERVLQHLACCMRPGPCTALAHDEAAKPSAARGKAQGAHGAGGEECQARCAVGDESMAVLEVKASHVLNMPAMLGSGPTKP